MCIVSATEKIINEQLAQQKRLSMNKATENIVYEDRDYNEV